MAQSDNLVIAVIGGAIVMVGYYVFTKKEGVLDQAKDWGAAFSQWLGDVGTSYRVQGEIAQGAQYYPEFVKPETPEGYNTSNWTWTLTDNTKLGLPAGMTPGEFCTGSPASPVCAGILR